MFNIVSRQLLEEHLGYERFVLNACARAVQQSKGESSGVEIVINDAPPHSINIGVADYVGSSCGAAIVREMSALAFAAAYKVIDMIVEWVIRENKRDCPWTFSKKLGLLNDTTLQFPDFLGQDALLEAALVGRYRELLPYRNAITHGQWGRNNDGDLDFDSTSHNDHCVLSMTFETVLDFGRASSLVAELLVSPEMQIQERVNNLRFLMDRLSTFHKQKWFNIPQPCHYRVVRRTNSIDTPPSIDLERIRKVMDSQSSGNPSTCDKRIRAEGWADWKYSWRWRPRPCSSSWFPRRGSA